MVNEAIATAQHNNQHIYDFHLDTTQRSNAVSAAAAATEASEVSEEAASSDQQRGDSVTSGQVLALPGHRHGSQLPNSAESLNWTFFEQVSSVDNQLRANELQQTPANANANASEIHSVDVIKFDAHLMSETNAIASIGQQQQQLNKRASFVDTIVKQQQHHQHQHHQQPDTIACNGIVLHSAAIATTNATTATTKTTNHLVDILSQQTATLNQQQHEQQQLQPFETQTFRFTSPTATFKRKKEQQQRYNNNQNNSNHNNNNNCISLPPPIATDATTTTAAATTAATLKRSPQQVNCSNNSNQHNQHTGTSGTIKRSPFDLHQQQSVNNAIAPTPPMINGCGVGLARAQTTSERSDANAADASAAIVANRTSVEQRRRLPAISIRDATATATATTTTTAAAATAATTTPAKAATAKRERPVASAAGSKSKALDKRKAKQHKKQRQAKMGAALTQAARADSRSSMSATGGKPMAGDMSGGGGGGSGSGGGHHQPSGFIDGMEMHFGLNGWRKKCLYALLALLMLLIVTNLVLTLWILKVMEFTTDGMGQLKIIPGGIQLTGQAIIMDMLRASTIRSRHGQPITIESSRNFSINTRDMNGMLENHLFLGHDKLECLASGFRINDTNGRNLFSVNRNEVTIGAHALRIDGEGGAIFRESIQTPHVRAEPGRELRLESPTRQLEMTAAKDITLQSRAGGIDVQALEDIKLAALDGSLRFESSRILMPNLRTAQPPLPGTAPSHDHLHRVFQLCVCSNGKLFLAAPHSICAGDDSAVCR